MRVPGEIAQKGRADLVGMHASILLVALGASFAEPRVDGVRIEALSDETANDACDGVAIQFARIGAFQPPVEGCLQKRRLVEVAEDLVDSRSRGFCTDAELLNLLQDPPPASPFDGCT